MRGPRAGAIVPLMVDFPDVISADPVLACLVDCVRARSNPELILLFGSRATGQSRVDSDYDLFLVYSDASPLDGVADTVRDALVTLGIYSDVLTRSAEQYARLQRDPGFLDFLVARQGRLLYSTGRLPQLAGQATRVREQSPTEGLAMWIRRANADLRIAEQSLATDQPVWDAVCFHAHAYAEKLIKALIVRDGSYPPRTHDLEQLRALRPDLQRDDRLTSACQRLMHLLPLSRYAGFREPTPDEARDAVSAAKTIQDIVFPLLKP